MKRKILWIEIVSTILALVILFVVSSVYVNNQNYKTAEDELNSYSNIACEVFDGDNFEELKTIITKASKYIRVTVIDSTGEVIIDSSLIEADNHLNREELQKLGECVSRYSESLELNIM